MIPPSLSRRRRDALWVTLLAPLLACCSALDPSVGALREASGGSGGAAGSGGSGGSPQISFARDIRPLMNRTNADRSGHGCKQCHYPGNGIELGIMATGLDLSTLGTLRKGGVDAPSSSIVIPGDPENSALVQKLEGTFALGDRMPKDGPPYWSPAEIQIVKDWITQGAIGADSE